MKNDAKMYPKWEPKLIKHLKIDAKMDGKIEAVI